MKERRLLWTLLLATSLSGLVWAADKTINLQLETKTFSCDVKGATLKVILDRLQKEKAIWFKGDQSVCEQEVTARFTDLPYHKGLTKILSGCNYSLVYDDDMNLIGVVLFGRSKATQPKVRPAPRSVRPSPPAKPPPPAEPVRKPVPKGATKTKRTPPEKTTVKPD
jgi:hypothetical protein